MESYITCYYIEVHAPAHHALQRQIDISLCRFPNRTWKRPPGRPRSKWLDQIRSVNNLPPVDPWRCANRGGYSGMTQQSQQTTR